MSQANYKKTREVSTMEKRTLPTVYAVTQWEYASNVGDRNIMDDVFKRFGVRQGYCEETRKKKWVAFPQTKKGKLTGYVLNNLLSESDDDKWRIVGSVTTANDLTGMYDETGKPLGSGYKKKIFVVEGQYDYLSVFQTLYYLQKRVDKFVPDVVSLTLGTVNAQEQVCNNHERLLPFEQMITVFDADENTPSQTAKGDIRGKEATEAVHMSYPQQSYYVELVRDSDPNDYVARRKGLQPQQLYSTLWNPKLFCSANMGDASNFTDDIFTTPTDEGLYIPEFPRLSKAMRGFRDHQLIVLMSPPKTGKTLFVTHVHHAFIEAGLPTSGAYFEATREEMQARLVAFDNKKDYELVLFGEQTISVEQVAKSREKLKGHSLVSLNKGRIKAHDMVSIVRKEAINGKRLAIIDHASFLIEGAKNERELISDLMSELAGIAKKYPICIMVVCHITFDKSKEITLKRMHTSKGSREWDEPFWYRISSQDARGGSGFAQLADCVLCIDKEYLPDETQGRTQLKIAEARLVKRKGKQDILTLDDNTGRLQSEGTQF